MITLQKDPSRDFVVLNLTDPQLSDAEWAPDHPHYKILSYTLDALMARVKPDLVTVAGDIAWAGQKEAYRRFADRMDSYGVPWAPVWGNHDNQGGPELIEENVADLLKSRHCLYERGDAALGNGNYVIRIDEDGKPAGALIMMDTHDRAPFVNAEGKEDVTWAKLIPAQLDWLRDTAASLPCDAALVMHIPIYAYKDAFYGSFTDACAQKDMPVHGSDYPKYWKFPGCSGVMHESIGCWAAEDGAMDVIEAAGNIRAVLCGHDHINSAILPWRGTKLVYILKTGAGCYWQPSLNGGTVLRIGSGGITEIAHEFVDASPADPSAAV